MKSQFTAVKIQVRFIFCHGQSKSWIDFRSCDWGPHLCWKAFEYVICDRCHLWLNCSYVHTWTLQICKTDLVFEPKSQQLASTSTTVRHLTYVICVSLRPSSSFDAKHRWNQQRNQTKCILVLTPVSVFFESLLTFSWTQRIFHTMHRWWWRSGPKRGYSDGWADVGGRLKLIFFVSSTSSVHSHWVQRRSLFVCPLATFQISWKKSQQVMEYK